MEAGVLIEGRYTLEGRLGQGGMAEVWRAQDKNLGRAVAIKFLAHRLSDDPEFLVRFFSEAQLVARISHPNVVAVLDFGQFDERPYLVMEYVDGGAIVELTGQPLEPSRAADIVRQAAAGAGAAHALGMVHRDIKPGNILLDRDDTAKLADFGIASSQMSERLTATGAAIGSPYYISPERAQGDVGDASSDVYSLGVVLYELITGRRPFEGTNVTAVAIAHVEQAVTPPSELVPDLDPALEAIVMRCLAKDAAQRFSDGAELSAALEAQGSRVAEVTGPLLPAGVPDKLEGKAYRTLPARRVVAGAAAAVLLLGLLVAAFLIGGRGEAPAVAEPGTKSSAPSKKIAKPTPSPSGVVSAVVSASPTPTPTTRERVKHSPKPNRSAPPRSPKPTPASEPSPSPSPTPQPTPTSAPTSPQPEPTPEPRRS